MHLVYRPCASDILAKMFDNQLSFHAGPVVAGGAARCMWFNQLAPLEKLTTQNTVTQSDIDVFPLANGMGYHGLKNYVVKRYFPQMRKIIAQSDPPEIWSQSPKPEVQFYESHNAMSWNNCRFENKYYKIQVIKKTYNNLEDLFDNFDFVNCQFATDGRVVVATAQALEAWRSNALVSNEKYHKSPGLDRISKYLTLGANPNRQLWNVILKKCIDARVTGGFSDDDYNF